MKTPPLICLLFALGVGMPLLAADSFVVCQSKYALCTTAKCTPVPGKKDTVSCACAVKTGFSAGQQSCQDVKQTSEGEQIRSRYFPAKSHMVCSNDRPWAWCLDKACIVDKNDPTKAQCACSLVKDQGPYIIVTDTYNKSQCETGITSSATVAQDHEITDFLKNNDHLKAFPATVLTDHE